MAMGRSTTSVASVGDTADTVSHTKVGLSVCPAPCRLFLLCLCNGFLLCLGRPNTCGCQVGLQLRWRKRRRQCGALRQSGQQGCFLDAFCICYTRTDGRTDAHGRAAAQDLGCVGPLNRNLPRWGWVAAAKKTQPALRQQSAGTEAAGGSGAQAETQTIHIQQQCTPPPSRHAKTFSTAASSPASVVSPTAIPPLSCAHAHNTWNPHTQPEVYNCTLSPSSTPPENPALPNKQPQDSLRTQTHTNPPTRQPTAPCTVDAAAA
jgi:hypothetical protein